MTQMPTIIKKVRRRTLKTNNAAGFTLLEVVTVMVCLMILGTIAALNLENIVYGSHARRGTDILVSDLDLARMTAMRAKRTVTVSFDVPALGQYTISFVGNGGVVNSSVHYLDASGRLFFDNAPPGSSPAPEADISFNQMGFARPGSGSVIGNIYVSDSVNGSIFRIATTAGGAIEKRTWLESTGTWSGTPLTFAGF